MNRETDHEMKIERIDGILAEEEEIVPSSGFAAAAMERVREEAAAPAPIPIPWKQAIPGFLLAAGVLGWGAWETARAALPEARQIFANPPAIPMAAGRGLEDAGWVALALAVSFCSWALARRLTRRSSWM